MDLIGLLLFLLCLLFLVLLAFVITIYVTSDAKPNIVRFDEEKYFFNPLNSERKEAFPDLYETPSVKLSVVVPSYNEEERLPKMLDESIGYLESRKQKDSSFTYEIIIVDDGSKDSTSSVGHNYTTQCGPDQVRVLKLVENRGKGGAVRLGVLSARGEAILFADADGATKFSDLEKLEESMKDLMDKSDSVIVVGSRAHLEKEAVATRSFFRTILMYGFHFLVSMFGVRGIRDTQCGFKLATRNAAKLLYPSLHVERWAFDVELLYIATELRVLISEVAVNWTEIEGSKVVPFWSWLEMLRDLLLIWLKYRIGAWKIVASESR